MFSGLSDGIIYLQSQSTASLLSLFWFTALFELPRYTFAFITAAFFGERRPVRQATSRTERVSVIVAGHNEAHAIERCVRSLREQSRPPDEIIVVSDGSTDSMPAMLRSLKRRGLIDQAHCTVLRGGKSAASNLAELHATGDIVVNVDCDCSFDRHALRLIVEPFADPRTGAVCGNLFVRNPGQSVMTGFQSIEYLISISLGKQAGELFNQVVCVSGGFGAFRRTALASVGGFDVGGGEDLDVTLRLRNAGWRIHFAADAIGYTDVPVTLMEFTRQRLRWERDAVRLRYRKHLAVISPFSRRFDLFELLHQLEFIVFNLVAAAAFPFYLLWLFAVYGSLTPMILVAAQAGLLFLDVSTLLLAAWVTPKVNSLRLLPFVVGYSIFNGIFMRLFRLTAYVQEWVFNASSADTFSPAKVQLLRRW
jgi:cellulose synthase/poly-beta-1,6-N-acetylglucosamine synthase-like glycosyltransferase